MKLSQIQSSKVFVCPTCYSTLCKTKDLNGKQVVKVKHKGMEVLAADAVIKCSQCKKYYYITAADGVKGEVDAGN